MKRPDWLGWRFVGLSAAALLLAACLSGPRWPWQRPVFRYLAFIDITQSMNAADYHQAGWPAERLAFVKAALHDAIGELPCGSKVGLGVFTSRNSLVLLQPVEVCAHFPALADALEHLDWRMAWAADSHIARGVYTALREAAAIGNDTRIIFFSDGQQFPPEDALPPFDGPPGAVRGLMVGVGGANPVPIPRLDKDNQPLGFWEYVDVRDQLPHSAMPPDGSRLYLTRLDEPALQQLAMTAGLAYHRLETPAGLALALRDETLANRRPVEVDLRWLLGGAAFILVLVAPMHVGGLLRLPK